MELYQVIGLGMFVGGCLSCIRRKELDGIDQVLLIISFSVAASGFVG